MGIGVREVVSWAHSRTFGGPFHKVRFTVPVHRVRFGRFFRCVGYGSGGFCGVLPGPFHNVLPDSARFRTLSRCFGCGLGGVCGVFPGPSTRFSPRHVACPRFSSPGRQFGVFDVPLRSCAGVLGWDATVSVLWILRAGSLLQASARTWNLACTLKALNRQSALARLKPFMLSAGGGWS